jgi:hypothetical protein
LHYGRIAPALLGQVDAVLEASMLGQRNYSMYQSLVKWYYYIIRYELFYGDDHLVQ